MTAPDRSDGFRHLAHRTADAAWGRCFRGRSGIVAGRETCRTSGRSGFASISVGGRTMTGSLKTAADAILHGCVSGSPRVPGVVAMATDRNGNIYEGAAGKRDARPGRGHDHRHRVRHLLDHQGDHRHGRPAAGRGGQARPRRARPRNTRRRSASSRSWRASTPTASRGCGRPSATSPPGCCCCTPPASATTSSTSSTTAWRRSTASPASSPPRRRRSTRRCCSIPATSGSTAATSTGPARSSKASPASGWAR